MGMSVASSTNSNVLQPSNSNVWQQNNQKFKQLSQELQSGDLSSAKQTYAKLIANNPNAPTANSPISKLGQALDSGNLSAAKNAISAIHSVNHHGNKESGASFSSILSEQRSNLNVA